ncbi:hypothetical protein M422DRAFT_246133 [Sphaerobolus stellatus SS14]|nr:hypothetical protein M422DRAFT_246133 [Sphaerobolus stellatus SS14]
MSDPMQHPFQFPPSFSSASSTSSAVDDGQNQQFIIQQIISSFVDNISRTQNLTAEQRDALQVFANFNSSLLQEILRLNLHHIQATIIKLENKMNDLEQKLVDILNQEQVSKQVITGEQRATMQATVKEYLVQTSRIQWDVAQEVIDFLEVNQVRFGFKPVFANPKLKEDLQKETRNFATVHRNELRKIIRNSAGLTQGKPDLKACLSTTVEDIARRFLNTSSAHVPAQLYIFVALLRYIASENPAWINSGGVRPHKGKDWWASVATWFQEKTKLWGNDWNVSEWVDLIQIIIANERTLHPEDPIPRLLSVPSIPVKQGVLPPTSANTEYMESSLTASMDHMDHAPVGGNTAGYSPFQYYNQASGSSSTPTQYYPQVNGPSSQPSVYSPDIPYQNSSYY